MKALEVRRLGLVPYADGLELQRALVEERKADRIADTLLLLQHPHVLTIGVKKDGRAHILASPDRLASLGVDVFETGRGGERVGCYTHDSSKFCRRSFSAWRNRPTSAPSIRRWS